MCGCVAHEVWVNSKINDAQHTTIGGLKVICPKNQLVSMGSVTIMEGLHQLQKSNVQECLGMLHFNMVICITSSDPLASRHNEVLSYNINFVIYFL